MQLSAANLLIASQQIARGTQQPSHDARAQFAAALAKEKFPAQATAFEPIEFTQTTPEPRSALAAAQRPSTQIQPGPLGSKIDIRV